MGSGSLPILSWCIRMSKIEVSWESWDGYIGRSRPQTTTIDLSEFDDDMDVTDIEGVIEEAVDDDFRQKIVPSLEPDELSRCTDAVLEYLAIERGE